jgi:hypothetical protein
MDFFNADKAIEFGRRVRIKKYFKKLSKQHRTVTAEVYNGKKNPMLLRAPEAVIPGLSRLYRPPWAGGIQTRSEFDEFSKNLLQYCRIPV